MPRRQPRRETVDELLATYQRVHRELREQLERIALEGLGDTWTAARTSARIAQVQRAIERMMSGIDPATGEPVPGLQGRIDPKTGQPYWQGLIGPNGRNGLAAELGNSSYAANVRIAQEAARVQGVTINPDFAGLHEEAASLIADELTTATEDHMRGILRKTSDGFRDIQARATIAAMTAGENVGKLTTRLVDDFVAEGQTGFTDRSGREWTIERYSRMLARTVGNKASQRAQDNAAAESNIDLVQVVGGIGGTSCDTCIFAVEQAVFSRSGSDSRYPSVDDLYGMDPAFQHPNCGHILVPYVEDSNVTQADVDKASQDLADALGAMDLLREEA